MIVNTVTLRCDECGRPMAKAQRVHNGHRFCISCYLRVFKRRMCPKCGNFARLPKNDASAICKKCETNKPCVRCGKTEYNIGKITRYGPVCSSCSPYFREMKPCGLCGKPSNRLTQVTRLGIDVPVCPKCARRDHATCPACRRHRLLYESPNGRFLCKACLDIGEIACPVCGVSMPAGRGNECEACYWLGTFRKRLKIDRAAFSVKAVEDAFGDFGEWLLIEVGGKKAAMTIHRYLPFFIEIEKRWGCAPSYTEFLAYFGAEGLRRVRLPMSWLKAVRGVVPDPEKRDADSERRGIATIMESVPSGTPASKLLRAYLNKLVARVSASKSTLRSVRLALRPAASLLLAADVRGAILPNQVMLDRYLLEKPGQMAAITGFINFLNAEQGTELVPKVNEKGVSEMRRKKLEAELNALMRGDAEADGFRERWLSVALAYFHGLPRRVGKVVLDENVVVYEDGGVTVGWDGRKYWIPNSAV